MAVPKVFISSTCYDLEEERAQLERFVSSYGFQAILSEFSDVFFDPDEHTHDSCVKEVAHCDLFILIISGRFGGKYISGSGESITQAEYNEAKRLKIPIFAFVKSDVLQAQLYYKENIKSEGKDFAKKIFYPAINKQKDAELIFSFIQSVQHAKDNNAIESYISFTDIENHLRKQWAGLFYNFLQKRKQQFDVEHISSILDKLSGSSAKLESLVESIHSNNQGEEKTKELITLAEIKQTTEAFYTKYGEYINDLFSFTPEENHFTLTQIRKAAAISPNKFDNFVDYLNSTGLVEVLEDHDSEITFLSKSGFGIGSNDNETKGYLASHFDTGVKLSNKAQREECLVQNLSKWINKDN